MATYKKKGAKKSKKNKDDLSYLGKNSTTAEVFTSLDQGANKIERFLEKNQKFIFTGLFAIIILVAGYMWYDSNIKKPKEAKANDEMTTAQKYFDDALKATDDKEINEDFDKALNGADGKYGFKKIKEKYSGTKAANLSNYYIGVINYKKGNFKEAVSYLSKFNTDDDILRPISFGMIGDAFLELGQDKDALTYYEKAANFSKNQFTTPKYLLKAGKVAMSLGNKEKAKKYFEEIKNNYSSSNEGKDIDIYLSQTK